MNRLWPTLALALVGTGCRSFERLEADDPRVGQEEVDAAGEAGDDGELTPHLHHILDRHAEYPTEVVVAALAAVARRGDPASVAHVAPLAADGDEEIRWHVAVALRRLGGPEAAEVLARMAGSDPSEMVRDEASAR